MPTVVTKTIKAAGGDFASLAALEATNSNLVALDEQWDVIADNLEETAVVNFNGWTTDATRFLRVRAADAHQSKGRVSTNAFRLVVNGTCLNMQGIGSGGLVIFEGIQLKCTSAAGLCIDHNNNGGVAATVRYERCVFESANVGINMQGGAASCNDAQFINCIFIAQNSCVIRQFRDIWLFNSTFITLQGGQHGCNFGVNDGRTKIVNSCYSRGGGAGGLAYNSNFTAQSAAGNDTSGDIDNVPYTTATFLNVTSGSEDLEPATGSGLIGTAADRSGEAAPFNYTEDIREQPRPLTLGDIGAFEVQAPTSGGDNSLLTLEGFKESFMHVTELSPQDLNILEKDLKAAPNTQYDSNILRLGDKASFLLSLIIVNTGGGGAGTAKLQVVLYADDETTILGTVDLATAIATNTSGTTRVLVTFGRGLDAALTGGGTIGTAIAALKLVRKCKIRLEVTVANNGTTSVGSCRLLAA